MQKILIVFGTRPEAIKMGPVVKELEKYPQRAICKVCVTAQHRQMLDQVLSFFKIEPDYDLDTMVDGQSLSYVTSQVLVNVERVIKQERPDWILVQGDTTTTMASSFAGFYQGIKVGHIEAGLRTWVKNQPFPEEANRVIADYLADLHFAPTLQAKQNLIRSGTSEQTVIVTGNTVIDALLYMASCPYDWANSSLSNISLDDKRLVLVTIHRRETFGEAIISICEALREIVQSRQDVLLIYPVHLNPNVRVPVYRLLNDIPNIFLVPL